MKELGSAARELCPLLAQLQISNVILIYPLRSHHHTQLRIFFENGCDVLCPPTDGSPESVAGMSSAATTSYEQS